MANSQRPRRTLRRFSLVGSWIGIWVLGVGSFSPSLGAHDPITTKVTWTREISAILQRRCLSCHVRGGYAGFSLATYEEARPWAVAIKEEVLAGEMPPWGAAPGVGHFANDRRLTRHEQELIASWVDGGAPYSLERPRPPLQLSTSNAQPPTSKVQLPTANAELPISNSQSPAANAQLPQGALAPTPPAGGIAIPLAPDEVTEAAQRTASVTLQVPEGMVLTAWTFEPGTPALVEQVDLELGSRWLGTWTPGESAIEFPADAGVPLGAAALFTARITYRAPAAPTVDYSRLRVMLTKEPRPRSLREVTVIKNWRSSSGVAVVALRPARERDAVQVVARFADGRAEPLGVLEPPAHGPHPTYRLARPLTLPAGARIEATAPVRLLYSDGATRTAKPNVRRRPRR